MTQSRKFKHLVRERMAATGEGYTEARRGLLIAKPSELCPECRHEVGAHVGVPHCCQLVPAKVFMDYIARDALRECGCTALRGRA